MNLICFDLETTGFSAHKNDIIEIGAVKFNLEGEIISEFQEFININYSIPRNIVEITGITDAMLREKGIPALDAMNKFLDFITVNKDNILIAHNANFDSRFLTASFDKNFIQIPQIEVWDSLSISKYCACNVQNYKLKTLIESISNGEDIDFHRALDDAKCVKKLILHYKKEFGIENLKENSTSKTLTKMASSYKTNLPLKLLTIKKLGEFSVFRAGRQITYKDYRLLYCFVTSKKEKFILIEKNGLNEAILMQSIIC